MSYRCDDDFYEDGTCQCPRCDGMLTINCYCGGDLCVCENYGEQDCPLCYGEGVVTDEIYNRYLERRAESARQWAVIAKAARNANE